MAPRKYTGRCPNHNVPLIPTNERNIGICPISDYRFKYAREDEDWEMKQDKFGNMTPDVKVIPLDGDNG